MQSHYASLELTESCSVATIQRLVNLRPEMGLINRFRVRQGVCKATGISWTICTSLCLFADNATFDQRS